MSKPLAKTRLCKIIPAEIADVENGSLILNLPNGEQYKVEGGNVPMKKGSLIRFEKDSFLKLTNEVVMDDLEEITIVKDEPYDMRSTEKNHAVWQDSSTRLLINLYKELRPEVNGPRIKTMKNMWEEISSRMQAEGYTFDHQQVESKWKSLVRSFRAGLIHGARRKSHYHAGIFEGEIAEILTNQGVSFEVVNIDENHEEEEENDRKYRSLSPVNRSKKTEKSCNEPSTSDMSLLIRAINRRTTQKEKADQIKQNQRERLINAIEERNQLLRKIFFKKGNEMII